MSSKKRVLCIEDQGAMIDLFRLVLGEINFEIAGALNGADGLEQARTNMPDVILLDLMMPEMDGWEVFKQLKTDLATKQIPVIVVTARSDSIDKLLGLHIAKVDDYIIKPFGPKELTESVNRVLARAA